MNGGLLIAAVLFIIPTVVRKADSTGRRPTFDFGGADDDRQTEVGAIDAAQIVPAWPAGSLAA